MTRNGKDIQLRPKTYAVLQYLVEHSGQLVSRGELLTEVWPGVVVTDGSIDQCVTELRKALEDDEHTMVRTVPRRGFIFDIQVQSESVANLPRQSAVWSSRPTGFILAGLCAALIPLFWWTVSSNPPAVHSDVDVSMPLNRTIAVLPFEDLSPAGDQELFAEGISEEILEQLAHVPDLLVIARNSSFSFKGSNEDLRTIAERLSVSFLLEGSVEPDSQRVRITARLIRASDGEIRWSQTYDRPLRDLVDVQMNIADQVARNLQVDTQPADRVSAYKPPDPEAYLRVLKGQALYRQRSEGDVERARDLFRQATEIDPDYALAWARLAAAYRVLYVDYEGKISYQEMIRIGLPAASRALELRPDLAEVQFRASNYADIIGDYEKGLAHMAKAIRIDPYHPLVQGALVGLALWSGHSERAIELQSRQLQRDPLSPNERQMMFHVLYFTGHFDEMREEAAVVSKLYPAEVSNIVTIFLVRAAIVEGNYDDAASMLKELDPGMDLDQVSALMSGMPDWSILAAEAMQRLQSNESVEGAIRLAEALAWQGNAEAAFDSLHTALERYSSDVTFVRAFRPLAESRISHFLAPLHDDPRWDQWISEMPFNDYFDGRGPDGLFLQSTQLSEQGVGQATGGSRQR